MKRTAKCILGFILFMSGLVPLLGGCSSTGYIASSVNTVIGLDVSENPKTQTPHARFGFVRSQYHYIPTGKSPCADQGRSSCNSNETPDLLSEIYVDSELFNRTVIHEKFAVGKAAYEENEATKALFEFTPSTSTPLPPPSRR